LTATTQNKKYPILETLNQYWQYI